MNYFNYVKGSAYPLETVFAPEEQYPEYPFDSERISEKNDVYRMIRDIFIEAGLDKAHVGTREWNPLGRYISTENTVLIKPNLVRHINPAEDDMQRGMECLITHPSIVRCIFDYVYIALKGKGKIVIADAPVQNCDFEKMLDNSGYGSLFEYFKTLETKEIKIEIGDLRETKMSEDSLYQRQTDEKDFHWTSRVVDIKEKSNFMTVSNKRKFRVTCYHGGDTVKHHTNGRNEYCISDVALKADVIINLVKPKSHRIAGYTAALKNVIGINSRKEYLPHHMKGSVANGGDEYQHSHILLKYINSTGNDIKNWALRNKMVHLTKTMNQFCRITGKKLDSLENNRKKFGMWSGNDTIWRTILDVNYIVRYCDKEGMLHNEPQRKILHIGDMIVCGEKEGPLRPNYKYVGGILFSENAVEFDVCTTRLMGFDYQKIPTLKNAILDRRLYLGKVEEIYMRSNEKTFNGYVFDMEENFHFCPTEGWEEVLGGNYK